MIKVELLACLHPCTKEILYASEDERGVVDSIDVDSKKALRHHSCKALTQVVDIKLDIHGERTMWYSGIKGQWNRRRLCIL